jgi:hypothetical protein
LMPSQKLVVLLPRMIIPAPCKCQRPERRLRFAEVQLTRIQVDTLMRQG